MPTLRELGQPLSRDWVLLVHTDGIRAQGASDVPPRQLREDPQLLANGLLQAWGRATDDALILVTRPA